MIKQPKGTQDYDKNYSKLQYLIGKVKNIFENHRGTFIETPVFELRSILLDKYGEDEKLIYNIADNDKCTKEKLSLRYDLTVPLVRYCVQNSIKKGRFARIGKVYRRETISKTKKRLREFYQADFDFVGEYSDLQPEFEIFKMIDDLLSNLGIDYEIQYNYRQNLEYYMENAKIDKEYFNTVCSSIDKLDKIDYEHIEKELLGKDIKQNQIDILFDLIRNGNHNPIIKEYDIYLMELLSMYGINRISYNPYLARGSDYYTGIIFEVKVKGHESSIVGGGRYDNMTLGKQKLKMIGFSFGIDRILNLFDYREKPPMSIYISQTSNFQSLLKTKLKLISFFNCKLYYNLNYRKLSKELHDAQENKCDFMIIIGEKELETNEVILRDLNTSHQEILEIDEIKLNYAICL